MIMIRLRIRSMSDSFILRAFRRHTRRLIHPAIPPVVRVEGAGFSLLFDSLLICARIPLVLVTGVPVSMTHGKGEVFAAEGAFDGLVPVTARFPRVLQGFRARKHHCRRPGDGRCFTTDITCAGEREREAAGIRNYPYRFPACFAGYASGLQATGEACRFVFGRLIHRREEERLVHQMRRRSENSGSLSCTHCVGRCMRA